MVSGHYVGLATVSLHGGPSPPSNRFQPDIAQLALGSGIGGPRNRCPPNGHPIRRRMVDELDRARVEVHRLHDAAIGGCPTVFRFPPQAPPTASCCVSLDDFGALGSHRVLAFVHVLGIIG